VVFSESIYALPGWPYVQLPSHHVLEVSQMAFRIFLTLLYNAHLSPEQCTPGPEIYGGHFTLVDMTVLVCSYAEFAGSLELIGPRMFAILRSSPGFWKKVANMPDDFVMLAEKLDNEGLYQKAVRHVVPNAHWYDSWRKVVELGKISEKQVHEFYKPQFKVLEQKLKQLRKSLHRLQLEKVTLPPQNERYRMAVTRSIDAIGFKDPKPKNSDRWSPLAHTIWGDFLVCELFGEKVTAGESGLEAEKAG
jgi:hypothetical protein